MTLKRSSDLEKSFEDDGDEFSEDDFEVNALDMETLYFNVLLTLFKIFAFCMIMEILTVTGVE